jgi:predicted nucleotidyltransferase
MDLHPDFKELLAECVAAKVEFAIVGGYAVGFHARPRATKDLDLLVLGVPENLARLAAALSVFGAPPNVVAAAKTARADDVIYFGVAPLRVDIMTQADGIDTHDALERAVYADLGTVSVPILGLGDLIANKRASGRKQDLADLEALELVRSGP